MLGVVPVQSFRVAENRGGLLKRHAVLLEVAQGFAGIPREHIIVYTLILMNWEGKFEAEKAESPPRPVRRFKFLGIKDKRSPPFAKTKIANGRLGHPSGAFLSLPGYIRQWYPHGVLASPELLAGEFHAPPPGACGVLKP